MLDNYTKDVTTHGEFDVHIIFHKTNTKYEYV